MSVTHCILSVLLLLLLGTLAMPPKATAQDFLPDAARTNGSQTLRALAELKAHAAPSIGLLQGQKMSMQALVLTEDGYLLTQASEGHMLKPWKLQIDGRTFDKVREVHRDSRLNLMLLHVEAAKLQPIEWMAPGPLFRGQWVWSFTRTGGEIRLGAISADSRRIPNSGVVLGVRFSPAEEDDDGLMVEEVAQQGPAFFAGLQTDDVIVTIDDHKVYQPHHVKEIISKKSAGEEVIIQFLRQGKSMNCALRLASKEQVMFNWTGEDFANHGASLRTDNFPFVIQHHIPLSPADMGGALFNLEGKAIGINIAKVDRVTNFALPPTVFETEVLSWITKDRQSVKPAPTRPR